MERTFHGMTITFRGKTVKIFDEMYDVVKDKDFTERHIVCCCEMPKTPYIHNILVALDTDFDILEDDTIIIDDVTYVRVRSNEKNWCGKPDKTPSYLNEAALGATVYMIFEVGKEMVDKKGILVPRNAMLYQTKMQAEAFFYPPK